MKPFEPTEYEILLLRQANGEDMDLRWGAAMGAALEFLSRAGYMTRTGKITEKGKYFLENLLTDSS